MRRVHIVSRQCLLDDYLRVEAAVLRHETAGGALAGPFRRLCVVRGDAAAALVERRDNGALVMVRQFRYPAVVAGQGGDGWLLEIVAGMLAAGEEPAACIGREIAEETGYRATGLEPIGAFFLSPGFSSERLFLFHASVEGACRCGSGGGCRAEGEDIEVVEEQPEWFLAAMDAGQIADAKTLVALHWYRQRRAGPPS